MELGPSRPRLSAGAADHDPAAAGAERRIRQLGIVEAQARPAAPPRALLSGVGVAGFR